MAKYANAPAVLVADIPKGGVFAQITGPLECAGENFRDIISGFIINRFRGMRRFFQTAWTGLKKRPENIDPQERQIMTIKATSYLLTAS